MLRLVGATLASSGRQTEPTLGREDRAPAVWPTTSSRSVFAPRLTFPLVSNGCLDRIYFVSKAQMFGIAHRSAVA